MPDDGADSAAKTTPWHAKRLWQIQPIRDVLIIVAVIALFTLGSALSLVTVPLLLALLIAYLLEPVVARLARLRRVSRSIAAGALIAAVTVFVVLPGVVGLAFGVAGAYRTLDSVGANVVLLERITRPNAAITPEEAEKYPQGWLWSFLAEALKERRADLGPLAEPATPTDDPPDDGDAAEAGRADANETATDDDDLDVSDAFLVEAFNRVIDYVSEHREGLGRRAVSGGFELLGAALRGVTTLGAIGFGAFLTAFFFFFFSSSYPKVLGFGRRLIPERYEDQTVYLIGRMDRVIAGFVRGRLIISGILILLFTAGYIAIGVPAAILVGIGVGALSIVPYLSLVGIPVAIMLMQLDPPGGFRENWWWILAAPTLWYMIVQAIDDYVLTPKIQGDATDMDTPTVLFSALAGGILFGFFGVLVAIPIAACIKILIVELLMPRLRAWAEGDAQDPLPISEEAH